MPLSFSSIATPQERTALAAAIAHNCECHHDDDSHVVVRCASHSLALAETPQDELTLKRLLYVRRIRLPILTVQEFAA